MRWVWFGLYYVGRIVVLLIACVVAGAVIGTVVGTAIHPSWHGAFTGSVFGAGYGMLIGLAFFAWGILVVFRKGLRGDYRSLGPYRAPAEAWLPWARTRR